MKKIFIALSLFFFIKSSAQTESRIFFSQLMVVFSDMENHFDYLKGEFKGKDGDESYYETIRTLDGTRDNVITVSSSSSAYQAMISDSTSEAGSTIILSSWKQKLDEALTGLFSSPAEFHFQKDSGADGYQYILDRSTVLLLRHKSEDSNYYWINLVIKPK